MQNMDECTDKLSGKKCRHKRVQTVCFHFMKFIEHANQSMVKQMKTAISSN